MHSSVEFASALNRAMVDLHLFISSPLKVEATEILLVSSCGRKTRPRHAENDLHVEGRISSLGNRSITATFELGRFLQGPPLLAGALCPFCLTEVHLLLLWPSALLQQEFFLPGAHSAELIERGFNRRTC